MVMVMMIKIDNDDDVADVADDKADLDILATCDLREMFLRLEGLV